jgi:hypothetical protein
VYAQEKIVDTLNIRQARSEDVAMNFSHIPAVIKSAINLQGAVVPISKASDEDK